jgi:tyrosine-protein phosphatase SIW14
MRNRATAIRVVVGTWLILAVAGDIGLGFAPMPPGQASNLASDESFVTKLLAMIGWPIFSAVLAALFLFSLPALADSSAQGINNFFQVDARVYRGAQPTAQGFQYLARIGIKTVLDLREEGARSSGEAQLVTSLGMQYVNVPMTGLTPPTEAEITKVLTLLEDATAGVVFVHCQRGADRTGAVIAAYRIDHDHWDNARALKEALSFGMSPFQLPRQNFIRRFQPLTVKSDPKSSIALRIEGNSNRLAERALGEVPVSAPGAIPRILALESYSQTVFSPSMPISPASALARRRFLPISSGDC